MAMQDGSTLTEERLVKLEKAIDFYVTHIKNNDCFDTFYMEDIAVINEGIHALRCVMKNDMESLHRIIE